MNLVLSPNHCRTISSITSLLVLSTFFYDYNEVKIGLDYLHVFMKLFVVSGMYFVPRLTKISEEAIAYNMCFFLYIHCVFSVIYIDSGYSNGFNQAFSLLLVMSANKIMRYYYHFVVGGFVLNVISLYYGAGFSYIKVLAGNPLSNYIHTSFVYAVMAIAAYEILVKKSALQLKEISRLAGIGLKSSYLMHEMKNLTSGGNNDRLKEILSCIDLIVAGKVSYSKLDIKETLDLVLENYTYRMRKEGIDLKINVQRKDFLADQKSFEIILTNLITNALEYLEENENEKILSITFNENKLEITNTFTAEIDVSHFHNLKFSTKSIHTNKGIGLNIVSELCSLNNIKYTARSINNRYVSTLELT